MTNGNSGVTRAFSAHFDLFLSHFGFRLSTRPVRNHTESDKNVGWIDSNGTPQGSTQLDADFWMMAITAFVGVPWLMSTQSYAQHKSHQLWMTRLLFQTKLIWIRHVVSSDPFASQPYIVPLCQAFFSILRLPTRFAGTLGWNPFEDHDGSMKNRKPKDLPLASWGSLSDLGKAKKKVGSQCQSPCAFNTKTVLDQICQIWHVKSETLRMTHGCFVWFDPAPLALRETRHCLESST